MSPKRGRARKSKSRQLGVRFFGFLVLAAAGLGLAAAFLQARYTFTLQSPVRLRFQWPLVIAPRSSAAESSAEVDQFGRRLTAYQLYTERGFQPWTTFQSGAYRQFLRTF